MRQWLHGSVVISHLASLPDILPIQVQACAVMAWSLKVVPVQVWVFSEYLDFIKKM